MMQVQQTSSFQKLVEKLHANQKAELDQAIQILIDDPTLGIQKKGDLSGVRVYKFKMVKVLTLLAYTWDPDENFLTLLHMGVHENFYRNLKH